MTVDDFSHYLVIIMTEYSESEFDVVDSLLIVFINM